MHKDGWFDSSGHCQPRVPPTPHALWTEPVSPGRSTAVSVLGVAEADSTVRCKELIYDNAAFPNTPSTFFWSSSPYVFSSGWAWGVDFHNGFSSFNGSSAGRRARCVR
jgi:hypothetical protein